MHNYFLFSCLFITSFFTFSQNVNIDQKVFLITLDGLRWQELFRGADSLLIKNQNYVKDPEKLYKWAWREKPYDRRLKLMPFIWDKVIEIGQILSLIHI